MLKAQIAWQASSSSTTPGRLPSKPEPNPKEQCNVIVLRSGTQLEDPTGTRVGVESESDHYKGVTTLPSKEEVQEKSETELSKESKSLFLKPYLSHLPFP